MATGNTQGKGGAREKVLMRGHCEFVEPLDQMILETLPEEGSLFAGMYPLGEMVTNIAKKLPKGPDKKDLPTSVIQTRLRVLKHNGMVVSSASVQTSGKYVWQRTAKGKKFFTDWKESRGGGVTN